MKALGFNRLKAHPSQNHWFQISTCSSYTEEALEKSGPGREGGADLRTLRASVEHGLHWRSEPYSLVLHFPAHKRPDLRLPARLIPPSEVRRCRVNTSGRPRVLEALGFQLLEELKAQCFQAIGFKHQPVPPYTEDLRDGTCRIQRWLGGGGGAS